MGQQAFRCSTRSSGWTVIKFTDQRTPLISSMSPCNSKKKNSTSDSDSSSDSNLPSLSSLYMSVAIQK